MCEFDIAIIGGGILAYATAFSILSKNPHTKIAMITGQKNSNTATLAAGAMLGCYAEVTKNLLKSPAGKLKHQMSIAAMQKWPVWLETIKGLAQEDSETNRNLEINPGTFVILNTQAKHREQENFYAIIGALNNNKEIYLDVETCDIPGFNPKASAALIKAIYLPNEGSIDSNSLLSALKKATLLAKHCVEFAEDVVDFFSDMNQVHSVTTQQGLVIKADKFLLAAGAHSHRLINKIPHLLNKIPSILSGMGLSLVVDRVPGLTANIRTANRAGACGLHLLPRGADALYIGATNELYRSPRNKPTLNQLHSLLKSAFEQINQDLRYTTLLSHSVGNRPVTLDGFPLMGKTSLENLWILSGTFRNGFHLSPLLAEVIASQMLGESVSTTLPYSIFSPERALIQTMSQEEAIKETVDEYLSSVHEQGMYLPHLELDQMVEEVLFLKIQRLYQKLGTSLAIPPEILIMLTSPSAVKFLQSYFQEKTAH